VITPTEEEFYGSCLGREGQGQEGFRISDRFRCDFVEFVCRPPAPRLLMALQLMERSDSFRRQGLGGWLSAAWYSQGMTKCCLGLSLAIRQSAHDARGQAYPKSYLLGLNKDRRASADRFDAGSGRRAVCGWE
jgi:hypothetical protein